MALEEQIIKNEGRIDNLKHNISIMKSQKKALTQQNKEFRKRIKHDLKRDLGEVKR